MSANATLRTSSEHFTNPTNPSSTSSSRSARQRCRSCLQRGKTSVKRCLQSLKHRANKDSHPEKSFPVSAAAAGAIASDPSTVPDFSELKGVELGKLNGGFLMGVGEVLRCLAKCFCCLLCGSVGCVGCIIGSAVNCLCCPVTCVVKTLVVMD